MLSDSTNAERPGHTLVGARRRRRFRNIFARAKGRIIVTSFASNVPRIQQVIDQAVRFDRKIAFLGRSLAKRRPLRERTGLSCAPAGALIRIESIDDYPPERSRDHDDRLARRADVGALAPLGSRSSEDEDRRRATRSSISATPIPGNEKSVSRTINNLYRLGATVIHGTAGAGNRARVGTRVARGTPADAQPDAAALFHSGAWRVPDARDARQPRAEDGRRSRELLRDRERRRSRVHGDESREKSGKTYGGNVMVDGTGVGDVGEAVLRDRRHLSADGIMMVVVTVDAEEARVVAGPDLISRGVFYLPESDGKVIDDLKRACADPRSCSAEGIRDVSPSRRHSPGLG